MRLYVECKTGIAADMFAGALLDLFDDKKQILNELILYVPENIILNADSADNYGLKGLRLGITKKDFQALKHGVGFAEVIRIIEKSGAPKKVKQSAERVYDIIADAECAVHGESRGTVHFHEVGTPRAIAGVICACALIDKLKPDSIVFSPINTGYGTVECAHGTVSVPAPATAEILKGIPCGITDGLAGELCTPTGAAFAKRFACGFENEAPKEYAKKGVGIGSKDIGRAGGVVIYSY